MNQLWAPWRLSYVASAKAPSAGDACFVCAGLADDDDRKHLIALRTPLSVAVLNRFPYNNGHLLIAPHAHKGRLDELTSEELLETMETLRRMVGVLEELMHPDGYNIGVNLGHAAGAGLPGHLHWHIVPRWHGDTNFMPVLTDVKVIVQSLDALYDMLVERLRGESTASRGVKVMAGLLPVVRCLLVCEDISGHAPRISLINLFGSIRSSSQPPFPFRYPKFCVYAQLTECRGVGDVRLEIEETDTQTVIYQSASRRRNFGNDPLKVFDASFRVRDSVFPAAGLYSVQLCYNGSVIAQVPLKVEG